MLRDFIRPLHLPPIVERNASAMFDLVRMFSVDARKTQPSGSGGSSSNSGPQVFSATLRSEFGYPGPSDDPIRRPVNRETGSSLFLPEQPEIEAPPGTGDDGLVEWISVDGTRYQVGCALWIVTRPPILTTSLVLPSLAWGLYPH